MWRTIALYAAALAVGAFALQWLQYNYLVRTLTPEFYVVLIAVAFTALGIWAGNRLTPRTVAPAFERNAAALKSLGVTEREVAVLELLATGSSNKEIARLLDISPNTVKTHIASLFAKLDVQRRTQAIQKARELSLVP
jgi:DNA-binding NarL/FixJ family response regulator